ncbi:MAG: DUF2493 domain-containing protein [Ruminococcaceae bacterium]|nr:DUF2493 domain-containing protein [Oscillospiraceae bacterium]
MTKRVIIAGSRNYHNYDEAKAFIDTFLHKIKNDWKIVFVSGGCKGADMLGERYAIEKGLPIERFYAEWDKYGRAAGPIRNRLMAEIGDIVICFWDGKSHGTGSMISYARKAGKEVIIKYI